MKAAKQSHSRCCDFNVKLDLDYRKNGVRLLFPVIVFYWIVTADLLDP